MACNNGRVAQLRQFEIVDESASRSGVYIWNRWESLFPSSFKRIDREHRVYGSLVSVDDPETAGWSIDYIASYRGKRYLIECDINKSATDVWHGFKIFGYRAAYCIDRHERPSGVGVMIFFNDKNYNHRIRSMMAVAGVEFCTFSDDGDCWSLIRKSLWR